MSFRSTWIHGTVRCFSSCTWADVLYCVSFRPRVASSPSFRHDDIVLAFCAFWFLCRVERFRLRVRALPNVAIGVAVEELEECLCVSRLSQLRLCPYLRVPEHHCGTYPSESMGIFVEVLQVQCCWRALFSDRARLGAQAALVS